MKSILHKSSLVTFFLLLGIIHSVRSQSLPADFPKFTTQVSGKTAPGKLFFCTTPILAGTGYYLIMANNDGTVAKYYKTHHKQPIYDFKVQCDGRLSFSEFIRTHSYTGGGDATYRFLNNEFTEETDSVKMGNEYPAESHEFEVLPNGHMICFSYSPNHFNLAALLPGANPNIKLYAPVIQELDTEGKVVFQWRFWNHFKVTDLKQGANVVVNTRLPEIDGVHTNSLMMDNDGNLVFSSLGLANIIKISRQTGKVIWQLGGKYNMFHFTNVDSVAGVNMCYGHFFRRLPNGNVLFYNNNVDGTTIPSKVVEWKLDEVKLTATKVWSYTSNNILGFHLGDAQRLSNGNTLIGWGDDGSAAGPACTELDPSGNKVFELSFNDKYMYTYRVYRYEFPGNSPAAERSVNSINLGNYDFVQGDTLNSGVQVEVKNFQGDGYNSMDVSTYNIAPLKPLFPGKAPRALQNKIIIHKTSISSVNGSIFFDTKIFGITNPEKITVYTRKYPDKLGLFIPVSTSYNSSTGKITANLSMTAESDLLELIFTYPDLEEISVAPKTLTPLNGTFVNNHTPIRLEWNTDGFVSDFNLQIATDSIFGSPVLDQEGLPSSVYYYKSAVTNQRYYWRVRTSNEAGYSNWSNKGMFVAGKPEIQILFPKGDEVLLKGLSTFIYWKANFNDSVVVKLYHNDQLVQTLGTVYSDVSFKWIPAKLDSTCGYYIAVEQLHHPDVIGRSTKTFSIANPTCVNTVVPFVNVLTPVASEKWKQGTMHTITWGDNISNDLQIDLYKDGQFVQDISTSGSNTQNWTVPLNTAIGTGYQVKITSKLLPIYSGMSDYIEITDSNPNAVVDLTSEQGEFLVYPNPVNDNMTLRFSLKNPGSVSLQMFNILGEKMDSWDYPDGKSGVQTLTKSIGNIPSGVYLVKLTTSNKTMSRRIIVQK